MTRTPAPGVHPRIRTTDGATVLPVRQKILRIRFLEKRNRVVPTSRHGIRRPRSMQAGIPYKT